MTHVTCRLAAKNRDQLRNPTLGNRVRATFTFFTSRRVKRVPVKYDCSVVLRLKRLFNWSKVVIRFLASFD